MDDFIAMMEDHETDSDNGPCVLDEHLQKLEQFMHKIQLDVYVNNLLGIGVDCLEYLEDVAMDELQAAGISLSAASTILQEITKMKKKNQVAAQQQQGRERERAEAAASASVSAAGGVAIGAQRGAHGADTTEEIKTARLQPSTTANTSGSGKGNGTIFDVEDVNADSGKKASEGGADVLVTGAGAGSRGGDIEWRSFPVETATTATASNTSEQGDAQGDGDGDGEYTEGGGGGSQPSQHTDNNTGTDIGTTGGGTASANEGNSGHNNNIAGSSSSGPGSSTVWSLDSMRSALIQERRKNEMLVLQLNQETIARQFAEGRLRQVQVQIQKKATGTGTGTGTATATGTGIGIGISSVSSSPPLPAPAPVLASNTATTSMTNVATLISSSSSSSSSSIGNVLQERLRQSEMEKETAQLQLKALQQQMELLMLNQQVRLQQQHVNVYGDEQGEEDREGEGEHEGSSLADSAIADWKSEMSFSSHQANFSETASDMDYLDSHSNSNSMYNHAGLIGAGSGTGTATGTCVGGVGVPLLKKKSCGPARPPLPLTVGGHLPTMIGEGEGLGEDGDGIDGECEGDCLL